MVEKTEPKYGPYKSRMSEETRQHLRNAREELYKSMEGILPPGFVEHGRNARKEMLKAWRSMIDASLERMEKTGK